jgi:hypothetical protein
MPLKRRSGLILVRLKQPTFAHNDDFTVSGLGQTFDFIVAQSIFSHAGPELVSVTLEDFARCLAPCGVVLATFLTVKRWPGLPVETPGWTYPGCTSYAPERILDLIRRAGLVGRELPWYHPRQTWYAMSLSYDNLPTEADDVHLSGAVLNDKEFAQSRKPKNE